MKITATVAVMAIAVILKRTEATKYNGETLVHQVHLVCCGHSLPKEEATRSLAFLSRLRKRWAPYLIEECCKEGCSNEEVYEVSGLVEECVWEGCDNEEISEACY